MVNHACLCSKFKWRFLTWVFCIGLQKSIKSFDLRLIKAISIVLLFLEVCNTHALNNGACEYKSYWLSLRRPHFRELVTFCQNLSWSGNFVSRNNFTAHVRYCDVINGQYEQEFLNSEFDLYCRVQRPPLWSSGQSSWLQIRRPRVRFPGTTWFSDKKKKKKNK
jgi:hypothetical protein